MKLFVYTVVFGPDDFHPNRISGGLCNFITPHNILIVHLRGIQIKHDFRHIFHKTKSLLELDVLTLLDIINFKDDEINGYDNMVSTLKGIGPYNFTP